MVRCWGFLWHVLSLVGLPASTLERTGCLLIHPTPSPLEGVGAVGVRIASVCPWWRPACLCAVRCCCWCGGFRYLVITGKVSRALPRSVNLVVSRCRTTCTLVRNSTFAGAVRGEKGRKHDTEIDRCIRSRRPNQRPVARCFALCGYGRLANRGLVNSSLPVVSSTG